MQLLNGEIAYSSDQRNNSYIFVNLETDLDSANTLMTNSDAAKLGNRCKLLGWIRDYLVRSKANQRLSVNCQGRKSGARGFWNGIPKSVSCCHLCLHNSEASHTPRIMHTAWRSIEEMPYFFKVIRQISRSHGTKISPMLTRIVRFSTVTSVWIGYGDYTDLL